MNDHDKPGKRSLKSPAQEQLPAKRLKLVLEEDEEFNNKIIQDEELTGIDSPSMALLLTVIAFHCKLVDQSLLHKRNAQPYLDENRDVLKKLEESWATRQFTGIAKLREYICLYPVIHVSQFV